MHRIESRSLSQTARLLCTGRIGKKLGSGNRLGTIVMPRTLIFAVTRTYAETRGLITSRCNSNF